jgi:23S rRNA (pseudouridine1915-N3)-methyltransferase
MKVSIILIGDTDQKEFKVIENQYIDKLRRYTELNIKIIKDPGKGLKLSPEELKRKEAKLILDELSIGHKVFLLDEKGKNYSSVSFAKDFLLKVQESNVKNLVLIIGGPFGFGEELIKRADGKISLSNMTFTHQMVRMILFEQLYRGYSILKGEKYHHE